MRAIPTFLVTLTMLVGCMPTLQEREVHHGIEFPTGTQVIHDETLGYLKVARIPERMRVQGMAFPPNTYLEFNANGRLLSVSVPKRLRIQGILFDDGAMVLFHPRTGTIASADLIQDTWFPGDVCVRAGSTVSFHPNGSLKRIDTRTMHEFDGFVTEGPTVSFFDHKGDFLYAVPAGEH